MLRSLKRARLPHVRRPVAPGTTLVRLGKEPFQCASFQGPKALNHCATTNLTRHSRLFSASASSQDDEHHHEIAEITEAEQGRDFGSPHTFDSIRYFVDGPPMELGLGKLATQTHSSVVGTSGSTVLLTTVARQSMSQQNARNGTVTSSSPMSSFLTVEYRQRHHGVGLIPGSTSRRDNTAPTPLEVLAGRAIDRALRPLLRDTDNDTDSDGEAFHYHVHASVQACKLWPDEHGNHDSSIETVVDSGHPVALALNTAAAALAAHLTEPVAATVLALMPNGTLLQDPTPWQIQNSHGELLYAGTRDKTVMMEWSSHQLPTGLPEEAWSELLEIAHATIQPLLDTVEELQQLQLQKSSSDSSPPQSKPTTKQEEEIALRESLGLPPAPATSSLGEFNTTSISIDRGSLDAKTRQRRLHQAVQFCEERLGDSIQRLFGKSNETGTSILSSEQRKVDVAYIHQGQELLSKTMRGRREGMILREISSLVKEFLNQPELVELEDWHDSDKDKDVDWLHKKVANTLMRRALMLASTQYGTRADSRGETLDRGWNTVRPLRVQVPALPMAVHGSALFARGDTQVLCTATLGPPRDGMPMSDPYQPMSNPKALVDPSAGSMGSNSDLPVGSLRFLRNQEVLVSDLNSKKVTADKERTGDSGSLKEVKRAFLQYDFPAYSTGEVPMGSPAHNRRAIGHGALAERAILPILPAAHDFPYAIRITSEVTDSNGSSSMASVCGATLALLDAGVPIIEPVAGVSVGAVLDASNEANYGLLLDITGTEDHYGEMDFKIAGTANGVTALQLDVKRPLSRKLLLEALELARAGRRAMLEEMSLQSKALGGLLPRPEPKESAPRVEVVRFNPQRKRDLVGPGGVILRQLEDRYGVSIDLTQEGQCLLFGANREMVALAKSTVMDLVADVVEGEVYEGTIIEIKDFGAIVELLRNKEGLLHVSELVDKQASRDHPDGNLGMVHQHLRLGQRIKVICTGVDPVQGTIKLSRKGLSESDRLKR
jgi:polyribonucleotide nucleotidyltransferase